MSAPTTLPVQDIHRHPLNPRRPVVDAGNLTASVAQYGILSPLTVITDPDGGYLLIAGERRLTAAKAAKLDAVPALIRDDLTHEAAIEALVMDNLQRDDLSPAEEARGYQCLLDLGLDFETIAQRVGRPVKHVQDHAKAATLHAATVEVLHTHVVTLDQALTLADLDDMPELRDSTLAKLATDGNAQQIINDALKTRKIAKWTQEATEYASANGITLLPPEKYDYSRMRNLAGDKKALAAHQKGLPCYAVRVDPYAATNPQHICTKVNAHRGTNGDAAPLSDDEKAEATEQRRRVIANNRRWDEMNTIRRTWIADFTKRTTPPKVFLPALVHLMARYSPTDNLRSQTRGKNAIDHSNLTGPRASMLLIEAVIKEVEQSIDKTVWRHASDTTATYLAALASWGYKLTDPEQAYVDAVKAGIDTSGLDYTPQP